MNLSMRKMMMIFIITMMYLGLIPRGETRKVWKKSTSFDDLGVKAGFKLLMVTMALTIW